MTIDIITFGESMTMFYANEAGELYEASSFSKALAGAETNVAVGLARLGFRVGWMSKVGDDSLGTFILNELTKERVDISEVKRMAERQTGILLKSKVVSGDPDVTYYRKGSAASTMSVFDYPGDYFKQAKHMHITGIPPALSKDMSEFTYHAVEHMKQEGKTISFDPNLRFQLWPDQETMIHTINEIAAMADWFLPGISEGKLLTGLSTPEEIAEFYLDQGVGLTVIKLGKEGAYYRTEEKSGYVPGFEVDRVVDTVGAGDGFAVGIISGLLDRLPIEEAVQRANAIGALAVMAPGDMDGLPSRERLNGFLTDMENQKIGG
ncbi:2-dehydro-3-deoxygluconokinase [Bacillus glycinifermentans]|uniref:2-dehydro-3-deoxygluconokinase n=1 Tax=Bacillus glycinifermentans TaxID=1664069 RepID=A0A0J6E417_9BACI|nr:sugar kinase [Bacillus glycinifermentans]ATH93478.1 sugar kinase [Bacillus glycinifermentans]KMM52135.1 2-dehydro-3-deoxygluconokinase [Bacillus glycinifermentans]KRT90356.1 2-dehydro-3-deoxygluconokinase [Bacillus glycinifermentans]MEC0484054.1 sugar kinase [Bacillus glycinifermentans]MEC0492827.1 sugar kinase [Bacillus glycinifermentans]